MDTNPLVFQGLFNDVQDKYSDHRFLYTDGSKDDHKVGCAVVSNFNIIKRRLPGHTSIYTAELRAIQLALDVVNNSNKDKYVICVDSLLCLQAIEQQHIDHPLVLDVLENYSALINKTVLFCWVPSHVGIRGNDQADAAAKAALNERLTIMTLPYSDESLQQRLKIRGKSSDFWATQSVSRVRKI